MEARTSVRLRRRSTMVSDSSGWPGLCGILATAADAAVLRSNLHGYRKFINNLRGHPKPAIQGHLQSGHTEGMD